MDSTPTNSNNLDFLNEKALNAPGRIKDMAMFALHNLHWLILCAIIGGGIAYYLARTQPESFSSSSKILLRMSGTNRNGANQEAAIMNGVAQSYFYAPFTTTINNEIMIITSKNNVEATVRNLALNVDYTTDTKYMGRTRNLYGETPVLVQFMDVADEDYVTMNLTLGNQNSCVLGFPGFNIIRSKIDSVVNTPVGRVCVHATKVYGEPFFGMAIRVTHSPLSSTTEHYRSAISVNRDDNANTILNLSLTDHSAIRAANVLNELVRVYNDDAMLDKAQVIDNTYDFINERIAQLDRDLGAKEGQLASFKQANQIISLGSLGEASMAKKAMHSEEGERLARQLSLARFTQESLRNMDDLSPLMVAFDDPTIASEVAHYNETAIKLGKYTTTGASQNPMVVSLSNELKLMKGNISAMLATYITATSARLGETRAAESAADREINSVPYKQVYVGDIERLQEVKSALYLSLLEKREELLISRPGIEEVARVIDYAVVDSTPVAPDLRRMLLIGILLGLLFPIAIMIIRRLLDTKVRYRRDIEESVLAPIAGEVPQKSRKDLRSVVVVDKSRDVISEAFRLIRSNISFLKRSDGKSTVYMTTSMMEGSGKTFVITNIASAYAIAGKKVVVVDLDLRKGTLTQNSIESLDTNPGMSGWLVGDTDKFEDVLIKDGASQGVDLVPSGALPPNPAELLLNDRLEMIIDWLRERYEYVFIDCVPTGIVADSDIVKRVVDSTLFIVRSGRLDKRDLPGLQFMYEQHKYPGFCIILNGIQIKKHGYGYGYGYGYGSGYGYGYGYGYSSTKKYGYTYGYESKKKKKHNNK